MTNSSILENDWNNLSDYEKYIKKAKWFDLDASQYFKTVLRDKMKEKGFKSEYSLLEKNDLIDPSIFTKITSDDLKEIGIESLGERKKLLEYCTSFNFDIIPEINNTESTEPSIL